MHGLLWNVPMVDLLGVVVFNHMGELAELRSFLMPFNSRRKALKRWNQI